ncbi:MAG TPA: polyketide cyclase [Xanthomonadaceae bacterium]|nr:polyketide cyclase [Xanthomonadaceae bacterium]
MTRLLEILISLAIVTVLFLVVGLVLPSSRHITETVETNRAMTIVFDTLNSFRRFTDWNPLVLRDPRMKVQLSGPVEGVGATLTYDSDNPRLGHGSYEITESVPGERIVYAVENPQRGHDKRFVFTFRKTGRSLRNIEISQNYDVKYGWDLLGRYAGLYVSRHVGDDMKMGLERLGNMLASVPNADYRRQGVRLVDLRVVDVPAQDLLMVNAGSIPRDEDKLKAAMKADMEWIKRSMDASGLVAAGPMRIVTSEFGRENYAFDVAVPVRRKGEAKGDADTEAKADAGTGATTDAAAEGAQPAAEAKPQSLVAASGQKLDGLKLLGPVEYVRTAPGRAATGHYNGYIFELENAHNMLRAWALTQGHEVVDRPFDVYQDGIDAAFTAEGQYQIYWALKD